METKIQESRKNKRYGVLIILVLALIVVSLFLISLTGYAVNSNSEEEIKIGFVSALSGDAGVWGQSFQKGFDFAVDEINSAGGVNGRKIKVIYEDDVCDPTIAVTSINKLINLEGLRVVLGPVCSSSVLAVAPIAEENKIIVFSTVATSSKITNAGDYVFRNRESDKLHGEKMAEFAFNTLNAKSAGVLFLNLDNGISFKESFKKRFLELGGEILIEESFEMKDSEYRTQLTKIKNANPDVLYFAGQRMENAVIQTRTLGLNQQILGPSTMQTDSLLKVAGENAEGLIYTYPNFDPQDSQSDFYNEKYFAKYNKQSEAYAANSYDALMILVEAIEACKYDTDCINNHIYNIQNYSGVSGDFSFDAKGDVERELAVKIVKNGQFVQYE